VKTRLETGAVLGGRRQPCRKGGRKATDPLVRYVFGGPDSWVAENRMKDGRFSSPFLMEKRAFLFEKGEDAMVKNKTDSTGLDGGILS